MVDSDALNNLFVQRNEVRNTKCLQISLNNIIMTNMYLIVFPQLKFASQMFFRFGHYL